jgi:hypothetical protein
MNKTIANRLEKPKHPPGPPASSGSNFRWNERNEDAIAAAFEGPARGHRSAAVARSDDDR